MTEDRAIWINGFASGRTWQNKLGSKLTKEKFAEYFKVYCDDIHVLKNPDQLIALKVEGLQNVGTEKEFQAENLLENFFAESKMKPTAKLMLKNAVFSFYKHNRRALEGQTASNIKNETPESKKRNPTLKDLVTLESVCHSARDKALIWFIASTSCRIGTVSLLKWSDLKQTKNGNLPFMLEIESSRLKGAGIGKYKGLKQITFLHKFAYDKLLSYKQEAQKKGYDIKPDSPLFIAYWSQGKIRPLTSKAMGCLFDDFIFEYQSMLKLARHFLRHLSASHRSCLLYSVNVRRYASWLGYSPDLIIQDVKPQGAIPDPLKVQNHCGFLNDYLAELQDDDLKPAAVNNCIKAVKTFYRVNGIEVKLSERLSRKIAYKDRAPKPEEITTMLDKSAIREAFIIAAIATGGFREGTFCRLKYRHVKEDLEANRFPIHIHVEAEITKGKYHDYDTFINAEASQLLKMYISDRRRGSRYTPPEEITDQSPLIRSDHDANKVLGVSEKTIRKIVHTIAVEADVSKKLPNSWMYSVRTHSLRKWFRTQMSASKIDSEITKYFMGKTIDTYEDVQSLGIETLRNLYVSAGLAIRPKTQANRIEQLKRNNQSMGTKS